MVDQSNIEEIVEDAAKTVLDNQDVCAVIVVGVTKDGRIGIFNIGDDEASQRISDTIADDFLKIVNNFNQLLN